MIAIVHADKNWGIGKGNDMMFSLPKDMKFFRATTLNHTVVMGGNTLRSFPGGNPLKNRTNIVLSRGQVRDDCIFVRSYDELKAEMKKRNETDDVYVIGGGAVYKELLPYCDEVLVTKVDAVGGAEVFFPNLDELENFVCVDEGEPMEDNGYTIRFTKYKNTAAQPL
ncbi:MAG: dihydrofolate reductase [Clostridiales bacterium]|nr:dihydrofolate reductase [Clostridiales bacterium]